MSDSEGDSDSSEGSCDKVNEAINKCINMKPEYRKATKKRSIKKLKAKLDEGKNLKYVKGRQPDKADNKKKLDECFGDLSLDLKNYIDKKFEIFSGVIAELLDRVDNLESKLSLLEIDSAKENIPKTYSEAVVSGLGNGDTSDRLERLEFIASEQERENRQLHILITHPDLNTDSEDLAGHVRDFMTKKMMMPKKEVDMSLQARKVKRVSTVLVICSNKVFRNFLYSARKHLRSQNNPICDSLFLNDNLTNLNFSLLRKLRTERNRRRAEKLPNFTSVFTFEGKVFTKVCESSPKHLIRDMVAANNFIEKIDSQDSHHNIPVKVNQASKSFN